MSELALRLIAENKARHARGEDARTLDLGKCGMTEVPEEVGDCVWLEELILSNEWTGYDFEKKQWQHQKSQNNGEANQIRKLPASLPHLLLLKKIVFSNTRISDLGPIQGLTNLQRLSCYNTQVSDLSPIQGLTNLQQLDCYNTQVSDLGPIQGLTNLQRLSCYKTHVSDLGPIKGLTNLQQLSCSMTKVSDLGPIKGLTNLQQLSCSMTKVSGLGPIQGLTNLQQLGCSKTKVSDLGPIQGLTNLQRLDCFNTQVSDLSPITGLTNLQNLDCFNTQVSDLSPVAGLTNLQQLDCSKTKVSDLGPVAGLTNLQQLGCSSTQVSDLGPVAGLTNLQNLDCSNTQVRDLTTIDWIQFQKLKSLDVSNSKAENLLPLKLLIQKGLVVKWDYAEGGICVQGCPLTTPPVEIVKQGNAAILRYFDELERARQKGETIRLAEAKCLLLGEGGAGKTSLARKLLDPAAALPEEEETTKGIAVHPLDLTLPGDIPFRLNLWDFGGQEIYHATHQFFLTKRSLYLLLDDTRKDEKTVNDPSFNYWLQVAELYGGGSPLLIVQNEKGDRSKQLDLRGMQGRFGFVKDAKAANLLTCRGLDGVWEAVHYWLKQLPHIHEEQPKAWYDIRRELERLAAEDGRDHISLDEYYRICAQHDIPERERALFLSGYLHDFGAFLHFQEHPLLRKTLVLNNQWATDAVYKVLDCETVKAAFGRFTRRDLAAIWSDARYADQHEELLALMEKFELCYKLPDEKTDTWLAPQLLSVLQPDALAWDESNNLQVRYEYEFMPRGLLSQHIVRMHRYVRRPELAWKSGVLFERGDAQALATEAWGSRNIRFRARGAQARELLTLLTEDLDTMHARLEGLKVRKMIPCNCGVCRKAAEPHFYDFENLERRRTNGIQKVQCEISYEEVWVNGLLDNVFAAKNFETRRLLEEGRLEEALQRLSPNDKASLLLARLKAAEEACVTGQTSQSDFDKEKNRICAAAVKLL